MLRIFYKKILIISILLILIFAGSILFYKKRYLIQNEIDLKKSEVVFSEPAKDAAMNTTNNPAEDSVKSKIAEPIANPILPESAIVKVPFLAQAPFANWDPLHEEACEETSLIMVSHYFNKSKIKDKEQGEQEILSLIDYENKNGYGPSVTLKQLQEIANSYFGLKNSRIVKDVTKENIEKEIAKGKPVIIPAAGKILPNPNFRNGGPNYHMLIIKGYNSQYFITNDPGTKNGEGYKYKFNDLINAIHDWNSENILNGEKAYLVFD